MTPALEEVISRYNELSLNPGLTTPASIARLYEALDALKTEVFGVNTRKSALAEDLRAILNKHSVDTACSTPDFILAEMVVSFLDTYAKAMDDNVRWHGRSPIGVLVKGGDIHGQDDRD